VRDDRRYPRRLIEVDLPIKRISAHARREKSIRHGHISTLHIWWARRPLAACGAVICAALWPDPGDELCPDSFRTVARDQMHSWAEKHSKLLGEESFGRFVQIQKDPARLYDNTVLRQALLDFIADFANWDNSTVKEYLDTSRALTQAAHEALGGAPGTRPLVVDPSPAAAPSRSKPCASARTPSPATSTPSQSCSTRSSSNTSPSTASASPMKSANGASGSSTRPKRNWASSTPRTPTARRPSPTSGRGRFDAKDQSVERRYHSFDPPPWQRSRQ
jgi:hypothetical protein